MSLLRRALCASATFAALVASVFPAFAADAFDRHTSEHLKRAIADARPAERLTLEDANKLKPIGRNLSACIVVRTNDGNLAKALVAWGFRRGDGDPVPVLLIERFVTYRGDRGDVTAAAGKDVMLFAGFAFNFDIGQVVPDGQGGDVRMTGESVLVPLGEAQIFGLDGPQLPAAENGAAHDPGAHEGVLPQDFSGSWAVDFDGRWRGEWLLEVDTEGNARGTYTSEETKSAYPVTGRVASPPHRIRLTIHLENAQQTVEGYLWTTDKSRMSGRATLEGRDFGVIAIRRKGSE